MNILTVVCDLNSGGVQRVARNFISEYDSKGHNSAVLVKKEGGIYFDELQESSVEVYVVENGGLEKSAIFEPDLIHIHGHGIEENIVKSLHYNTKATLVEHNVWDRPSSYQEYLDASCLMSRFGLWRYQTHIDSSTELNTTIIPNPTVIDNYYPSDDGKVQHFKQQMNIPEDGFIIGRVGQAYDGKWSPLLLSAFYKLAVNDPDVYLAVRGSPDGFQESINIFPEEIRNRIIQLPFLDEKELRQFYSSIDVFVHAAKQGETFGNVLVESMLCETPVVSLSTPYNDNAQVEVVGNNVGGLVASSPIDFINSVEELYNSPKLRKTLAQNGRYKANNKYDLESISDKVISLVDREIESEVVQDSEIISQLESIEGELWTPYKYMIKYRREYEQYIQNNIPTNRGSWNYIMKLLSEYYYEIHLLDWDDIENIENIQIR